MYNDKLSKSIAEAAKKVMDEELKGNQHKIDVNKNNKIDAEDFKHLRAGKKPVEEASKADVPAYLRKQKGEAPLTMADVKAPRKDSISHPENLAKARNEEVELDEEIHSLIKKHLDAGHLVHSKAMGRIGPVTGVDGHRVKFKSNKGDAITTFKGGDKVKLVKHSNKEYHIVNEEAEQLQEYESKGGVYKHQGTYGRSKDVEAGETDWKKEEKGEMKEKKPRKLGARQNFVRSKRVNEGFSAMLEQYEEKGIKGLFESFKKEELVEEPTNDEYHNEVKKAQDKSLGKDKAEVAKPAVQAVQQEEVEQIEERQMTEPEMKKKEEIVKSMKKGIQGFKDRYGERAKEVMYATATKQAMKD